MGNMYDDMNVLKAPGAGNKTVTSSTGTTVMTLAAGGWAIWADQDVKLQIATTSTTIGATPTVWPARHIFYYTVPHGNTEYALISRRDTTGTAFANNISGPV